MSLAHGKVALVLEGGYSMDALCDSAEQCSRALMGHNIEKISHDELSRPPCFNAVETLQKTLAIQSQYWTSLTGPAVIERVGLSHFQSWGRDKVVLQILTIHLPSNNLNHVVLMVGSEKFIFQVCRQLPTFSI